MQLALVVALAAGLVATLTEDARAAPVRADRCFDDDKKFLALLASRGHGGKLTGCSDPFVQPRCSVDRIRKLCCASCRGIVDGPDPIPLEPQTKSVCVNDDSKLKEVVDSFMPGATVDGWCSNPKIKQKCHVDAIKEACCAACSAESTWTHMFIPYNDSLSVIEPSSGYPRTDPNRQHLHIRQADGCPEAGCPVHFYAHGNGGDADLGAGAAASVTDAGYTLISWESVSPMALNDADEFEKDAAVCDSDANLVIQWTKDNHAQYNLDINRFVIGGRSRGTGCSWGVAHSNDPAIIGIYMYAALPDPAWTSSDGSPVDVVTANSPPAWLGYSVDCGGDGPTPECPGNCHPDTPGCLNQGYDIHNPANGLKVADAYAEHGIADKIEVVDGLRNGPPGTPVNINANFADFVASLP